MIKSGWRRKSQAHLCLSSDAKWECVLPLGLVICQMLEKRVRGQFSAAVEAEAADAQLRQRLQVLGSEMEMNVHS